MAHDDGRIYAPDCNEADEAPELDNVLQMPQTKRFNVGPDYDYLDSGWHAAMWREIWRGLASIVLRPLNAAAFGLEIRGKENLWALESGAVVVANHVHPMDCTFLDTLLWDRRTYYATLEANFRIPVVRHLIKALGGVPVPENFRYLPAFRDGMKQALEAGSYVCIYPEGVLRPYYGGLRRFRDGAFMIAAEAKAPVLPVVITFRHPDGLTAIYKKKPCITVTVLPPVYPEEGNTVREECRRMKQTCFSEMKERLNREDAS